MNDFNSRFSLFLTEQYGFRNIRPFECINSVDISQLFTAEDSDGNHILVKRCKYGFFCKNEYEKGMMCYKVNPQYVPRPVAYCDQGEFSFMAQEYKPGRTLEQVLKDSSSATAVQKLTYIEDIFNIFTMLRQARCAHRDIHVRNILVHQGHCNLVDFQIAVDIEHYQELPFYQNLYSLVQIRGDNLYSMVAWDDAHTLLLILRMIGCEPHYQERYVQIETELTNHIGRDTIWYNLPSPARLKRMIRLCRLKAFLTPYNKSKQDKYRSKAKALSLLLKHAQVPVEKRQFPKTNEFKDELAQLQA